MAASIELIVSHRRPKLTLLHLFIDLFRKEILPHSSEYLQVYYKLIVSEFRYVLESTNGKARNELGTFIKYKLQEVFFCIFPELFHKDF